MESELVTTLLGVRLDEMVPEGGLDRDREKDGVDEALTLPLTDKGTV
jgi:hypothetical protein